MDFFSFLFKVSVKRYQNRIVSSAACHSHVFGVLISAVFFSRFGTQNFLRIIHIAKGFFVLVCDFLCAHLEILFANLLKVENICKQSAEKWIWVNRPDG